MGFRSLFIIIAFVVGVASSSCGPNTTTNPPAAGLSGLTVVAPQAVEEGASFPLSVVALGSAGDTLTSFSGAVTLTASTGVISPSTLTLSAGVGATQATITGGAGDVQVEAAAGSVQGTTTVLVIPPCTTVDDDLILTTQDEVDASSSVCEVTGVFAVFEDTTAGDPIVDLSPLSRLETVGTWLTISRTTQLTDLSGLDRLMLETGTIQIRDNQSLATLSGLGMDNAGTADRLDALRITDNAALADIGGLANLVPTYVGLVEIERNADLVSLDGLEAVDTADVDIVDNALLSDIDALGGFRVGTVEVRDNPSLSSVDAFGSAESVNELHVLSNGVTTISLGSLGTVGWIAVGGNPDLTSIDVTAAALDHLSASNEGLSSVTVAVDSGGLRVLNVTNNPSLSSVDVTVDSALSNLALSDLPSIATVSVTGGDITRSLQINQTGFTSLPALPVADTLSGSLSITANESLSDISALDNVVAVGSPDDNSAAADLRVLDNPALCVPSFVQAIELLGMGGSEISGNKTTGC